MDTAYTPWAHACCELGDHAKARDFLQRAIPISTARANGQRPTPLVPRQARRRASRFGVPLHAAAKRGGDDAITRLLDDGAEVDRLANEGDDCALVRVRKTTSTRRVCCWRKVRRRWRRSPQDVDVAGSRERLAN